MRDGQKLRAEMADYYDDFRALRYVARRAAFTAMMMAGFLSPFFFFCRKARSRRGLKVATA